VTTAAAATTLIILVVVVVVVVVVKHTQFYYGDQVYMTLEIIYSGLSKSNFKDHYISV